MQSLKPIAFVLLCCCFCCGPAWAVQDTVTLPATPAIAVHSVEEATLGETKNVHCAGDLFLAGQFCLEDLDKIKSASVTRIITLRMPGEIKWDEKTAVDEAGIEFVEVPFRTADSLTDEVFDKIRELLRDKSKKTLFHCGSANRVGGVWLPYRVLDEGVDVETALAEAKEIGLRNSGYEKKALEYIEHRQAAAREESVKPGVNKRFVDPALDVKEFIDRFEVESREVFANREKIVAATNVKVGDQVADIGAGTGLFTRLFSSVVGEDGKVFAVDISPKFIDHITADATKNSLTNITAVLCEDKSVKLAENSVDVVFICDTYHHFEYPKSTLASIHRALTEGGHLILIDFERIPGVSREWLLGHVRAGKEVFRSEIQDAGFTLVEEKKIEGFKENYFLKFRKN